ncbi:MAG TPA: prolipoprotein diacylglyceryl transferase family protein [Polyangiaceae bacterium]
MNANPQITAEPGHHAHAESSSSVLVTPSFSIAGRSVAAFHLCGTIGFVLSLATWFGATSLRGLSLWVMAALVASSICTFLGLALLTKLVTGQETLVYYRHEVLVLGVAGLVLWGMGEPVLAYLDLTLLGVGVFLGCGRVGCLMVGCCYGRPHWLGVRYGHQHAAAGFPHALVGVRLLPVQLIEAVTVASVVAGGLWAVARGAAPGEVLAWYSVVYGVVRFGLEFARGDGGRPYYGSFSEAQWTTAVLMGLVAVAELLGVLPREPWHLVVTAALMVFMLAWGLTDGANRRLFRAAHLEELAAVLRAAESRSRESGQLHMGETRGGLRLSACTLAKESSKLHTLAFSGTGAALSASTAERLAVVLSRLEGKPGQLIRGRAGVYHLVFAEAGGEHGV